MPKRDPAVDIVSALIRDLCSRAGGDEYWEPIDPETRREHLLEWRKLVRAGVQGRLVRTSYGGWRIVPGP